MLKFPKIRFLCMQQPKNNSVFFTASFFKKNLFLAFFISLPFTTTYGQITIDVNNPADVETNYSPEQLIKEVLITGACADIPSVTASVFGDETNNNTKSYGYFKRNVGSTFPFEEGIVLTTGQAFDVSNTASPALSTDATANGDADNVLENLINAYNTSEGIDNVTLTNANAIEFEFTPTSNTISFRYIMASEEYQGTFPCSYADAFGFLLKEKDSTDDYVNLAVVPGTTTPVAVTTVNSGFGCDKNPDYYAGVDNDTNFEGRTEVLTATATVTAGTTYTIRLVIADAGPGFSDSSVDSAVFLEAGSFNLGLDLGDDLTTASGTAVCGNEKLLDASITADSYQWFKDDAPIAGATNQTYLANLGDGVYKCEISSAGCASGSDEITVEFLTNPMNNTGITALEACDTDTDLIVTHDLTSKTTEILNGQDPAIFEVRYFLDATNASNNTTDIPDPTNYTNTNANETIYIRIHNRNQVSCAVTSSFSLKVTAQPVATAPTDYNICDNTSVGTDTDGFVNEFVLTNKDAEILGSLDATQFTVTYHATAANATANTDPLDKTTPRENATTNLQTVYVRLTNNDDENCFDASKTLNLVVNPLPVITNIVELKQCDDDIDGFSSFNLNEAASDISTDYLNETFVFFPTLLDAQNNINDIDTPNTFENRTVNTDTVWARAITSFGCYRIAQVNLIVSTTGIPTAFQREFTVCDDFLDANGNDTVDNSDTDGISAFDFSSVTPEIISLFPPGQVLKVTYYRNKFDALAEINVISDPSNYRNIGYANNQTIYARVDSDLDNDCLGFGAHITLNVNPVPSATVVDNMIACDNLDDGNATNGEVAFDLESNTPTILGTQSAADYTVTYHETPAQAQSGANPLASPYTNTTRDLQTIYVRVTNNTTGCFTNHEQFDLIVNPLPVANFVDNIEICDDASDGSANNGFSQSIDLSVQTATILGTQDPAEFSVSYHTSLFNAQNNVDPVDENPYTNDTPFRETIYVRVFNATTGCANGISTFDVIVHGAPNVLLTDISNLSLCDDATDGDDTNGIVQNFDLTTQTTSILNNYDIALHDDFTISYHRSQAHAETGDSPITDSEASQYQNTPQPDGSPERIYIRVTNKDTGCISTDTYFDLIVNPLPDFEVTTPQIVCLNDTPLTLIAENPTASYSYQWTLVSDGSVLGNNQTLDVLEAGVYRVTATNTTTGCSRFYDITVNASEPAKFTLEDITIVDDSDNNTISINTTNLGIGDYEYALTNEQGDFVKNYQDTPVFENLEGGIYTILIRDKNGCDVTGVPTLTVPVIEYPKFFTPNNDGVNDTWFIKGANSTFFQSSAIYIFNRYGKAVAEIKLNEPGWDGTYNGKKLPSDDYWFSIKLQGETMGNRERKGHFSLIRR